MQTIVHVQKQKVRLYVQKLKYSWMPSGRTILHKTLYRLLNFYQRTGQSTIFSFLRIVECYPHADTTRTCLFSQDSRMTFFVYLKAVPSFHSHTEMPLKSASAESFALTTGHEREMNWSTAKCYSRAHSTDVRIGGVEEGQISYKHSIS